MSMPASLLPTLALLTLLVPLGGCGGVKVANKQKLEIKPVALPLRTFGPYSRRMPARAGR